MKKRSKVFINTFFKNPETKIDLSSFKKDELRFKKRISLKGFLLIHDMSTQKQYRVNIKNISSGGICIEIGGIVLRPNSEVVVEFCDVAAKTRLGTIKSKVMWINPMFGHLTNNNLVGLEFSQDLTPTKIKKIEEYVEYVEKLAG